MITFATTTLRTEFGPFSVATDDSGAVRATAFGSRAQLLQRLGQSGIAASQLSNGGRSDSSSATRHVVDQVRAYFAGDRRDFTLTIATCGTTFQERVWAALREIPFGGTRSYGELAAALGNAAASRAVGRANASNPVCLIVPCHRVIGANGSLTGFAFGEAIKRRLLEHEGAIT